MSTRSRSSARRESRKSAKLILTALHTHEVHGALSFANDVFISYAHIDNEPLPAKTDGWVTLFDNTLRQRLRVKPGKNAVIWRDLKLGRANIFYAEIDSQLERAAVLISVLSPRYVKDAQRHDSWERGRDARAFADAAGVTTELINIGETFVDIPHRSADPLR